MATIFGTQGRDTLKGTERDDVIRGWAENGDPATDRGDGLSGFGGQDEIYGGGGGDALDGGVGDDVLDGGDGDDQLWGGAGNDALFGGKGDDYLFGWTGADRLSGGAGNDVLTGGDLGDTFMFRQGDDKDTILGFQGRDMIELGSSLGVKDAEDALSHATVENGDTVFRFGGGDRLVLEGFSNLDQLRDNILII